MSDHKILLVPGGPGLGAEYLESALGSVSNPKEAFSISGISTASEELIKLCQSSEKNILLGHSFGGMLILNTPALDRLDNVAGFILLNTAPDLSWKQEEALWSAKLDTDESRILEKDFFSNPSDEKLKKLFCAWAPWYFTQNSSREAGLKIFRQNSFSGKIYLDGLREFYPKFQRAFVPKKPTLIISGELDRLTPISLFQKHSDFKAPHIEIHELKGAGHFPWLEKPSEFQELINSFLSRFF